MTVRHAAPMADNPHADLIEIYLRHLTARRCTARTIGTYRETLVMAHDELPAGLPLATRDELEAWLSRPGWSTATAGLRTTIIRSWARWAIATGHMLTSPGVDLPQVRQQRRHVPPATTGQVTAILTRTTGVVQLASLIAAYAGLRAIEICRLDRADITPEALTVREGKGGHGRTIPMHPVLWRAVAGRQPGRLVGTSERLLASRTWRAYRRVGVETSIHKLRKWWASEMRRSGVDLETIRQLLGHTSLVTTQRYLDVDPSMQAAAVALLPALTADAAAGAGPAGAADPAPAPAAAAPAIGPRGR